jgi:DNA-binding protein HU-beta
MVPFVKPLSLIILSIYRKECRKIKRLKGKCFRIILQADIPVCPANLRHHLQGIQHDFAIESGLSCVLLLAKKPMTKSQIVTHFAEKFELTKKTSAMIIEEVAGLAIPETKKTGSFTVPGIGKLILVKRKARMGRNPATGKAIKIPAKTVIKMRIAKAAKEAIVSKKK